MVASYLMFQRFAILGPTDHFEFIPTASPDLRPDMLQKEEQV